MDVVFNSIASKLYTRPNLKPKHCHDVVALSADEEKQEDLIRKAIFQACNKEVPLHYLYIYIFFLSVIEIPNVDLSNRKGPQNWH